MPSETKPFDASRLKTKACPKQMLPLDQSTYRTLYEQQNLHEIKKPKKVQLVISRFTLIADNPKFFQQKIYIRVRLHLSTFTHLIRK